MRIQSCICWHYRKSLYLIISYPIPDHFHSWHDCKVFDEAENQFVRLETEQMLCKAPDVCIQRGITYCRDMRPKRKTSEQEERKETRQPGS